MARQQSSLYQLVERRDNHTAASSVFDSTQWLRLFLPWSTVSVIVAANSQGHSPEFCWTLRAPGNAKRCMQIPIYAVGGDFNKLGPQRGIPSQLSHTLLLSMQMVPPEAIEERFRIPPRWSTWLQLSTERQWEYFKWILSVYPVRNPTACTYVRKAAFKDHHLMLHIGHLVISFHLILLALHACDTYPTVQEWNITYPKWIYSLLWDSQLVQVYTHGTPQA